jgi:hypothetical protein
MKIAVLVLQNLIRLLFVALLVLGVQFWTGQASSQLVPLHMRLGEVMITLLWIMAGMSLRFGASAGLVLGTFAYGVVVVGLGMKMADLVLGGSGNLFGVLHLIVGIGAVGLAEMLGARMKRAAAVRS